MACLLPLLAACTDGDSASNTSQRGALAVDQQRGRSVSRDGSTGDTAALQEAAALEELDCQRGGATAPIAVTFACDAITVVSCKDLSNVVIEFVDGSRERFDGLRGHHAEFAGTGANRGAGIVGVWVKAGANHSGDGPGYGQRFVAAEDSCPVDDEDRPPGSDSPPGDVDPPADDPPPPEQINGPTVVF